MQGGSNMTGTDVARFTHKSVPVILEPPCITGWVASRRCEEIETKQLSSSNPSLFNTVTFILVPETLNIT